ncbi:hypothetical protein [Burkholderia cepacia]|uniref:hypothetical protein n=1 Tax=Burkholderia cepacia TaxID=292 RepID=UPI001CF1858E|nr:hypothetical protein [Burkholderia cepacia]MCA8075370.1 hypothetical protein [Burkholderia cepacia]
MMEQDSLEYRVRRRAELKQFLGMNHIAEHVARVVATQDAQAAAAHLHLRVAAARHTAGDILGIAGMRKREGN